MLRKMSVVFGLCILASLSAQAQDKVELFGGYSYLRFHTSPSANLNGWESSGQYKFTDWLGGVADIDGHYGSIRGISTSTYTYLFGPQVSWPARVSPRFRLASGDSALGPRRVPHAFVYDSTGPGRLLVGFTPAGRIDQFFRDLEKRGHYFGSGTPEEKEIARREYGIVNVGPPLTL